MSTKVLRAPVDLALWAESYARERSVPTAVVVGEALRNFRDLSQGGVRDLPVPETPAVRAVRAEAVPPVVSDFAPGEYQSSMMERQRKLNEAKYRNKAGS